MVSTQLDDWEADKENRPPGNQMKSTDRPSSAKTQQVGGASALAHANESGFLPKIRIPSPRALTAPILCKEPASPRCVLYPSVPSNMLTFAYCLIMFLGRLHRMVCVKNETLELEERQEKRGRKWTLSDSLLLPGQKSKKARLVVGPFDQRATSHAMPPLATQVCTLAPEHVDVDVLRAYHLIVFLEQDACILCGCVLVPGMERRCVLYL